MVRDACSFSRSDFLLSTSSWLCTSFARNKIDRRPSSRAYVVYDTSNTHQGDTARVDGVVGIARPMRRSPSVHNALVLNLRSGDANLDVRRRSPPLAISFSLFLYLSFSRYESPSRPAIITMLLLSPTSFKLVSFRICSLYSSPPPSLSLSHSSCASCRRCCHLTGDLLLATIRDE